MMSAMSGFSRQSSVHSTFDKTMTWRNDHAGYSEVGTEDEEKIQGPNFRQPFYQERYSLNSSWKIAGVLVGTLAAFIVGTLYGAATSGGNGNDRGKQTEFGMLSKYAPDMGFVVHVKHHNG